MLERNKEGEGRRNERGRGKRTSWERNHLIPLGRKVRLRPRFQDPFIENTVAGLRVGLPLYRTANLLHTVRSHEVGIALIGLVNINLLERALSVVASTEILHLRQNFDHRREAEDGYFLSVEVDEAVAEAGAVGEVVFGVCEILFVTGRAVLEKGSDQFFVPNGKMGLWCTMTLLTTSQITVWSFSSERALPSESCTRTALAAFRTTGNFTLSR